MLAEALEIVCRSVSDRADVRDALVAEKLAALTSGALGPVRLRRREDAVGIAVLRSGGTRAALLGVSPAVGERAADLLADWIPDLRAEGVRTLAWGGPPGCYVHSGVDAADAACLAFWRAAGWSEERRHVDLAVTLRAPGALDSRVRRALPSERDAVIAWVRTSFLEAWAQEVARAFEHDAVWLAEDPDGYVGFGAHSGNNAALGTFGPVGVLESQRGGGLGGALTQAALDDLATRGFERAVIPWVNPRLVAFYEARVASLTVTERVILARAIGSDG